MNGASLRPLNVFCKNPNNQQAKYHSRQKPLVQNRRYSFPSSVSSLEETASLYKRMDAQDFWNFRERQKGKGLRRTSSARHIGPRLPSPEKIPISRLPRGIKGTKLHRHSSDVATRRPSSKPTQKRDHVRNERKRQSVYDTIPLDHEPLIDDSTQSSSGTHSSTSSDTHTLQVPFSSDSGFKSSSQSMHSVADEPIVSLKVPQLPRNGSNHKLPRNSSNQKLDQDPNLLDPRKLGQRSRSANDLQSGTTGQKAATESKVVPPPLPELRGPNYGTSKSKDDKTQKGGSSNKPGQALLQRAKSREVEEEEEEIKRQKFKFDVAKVIPKERISESESFEGLVKFLRFLMYILIMTALLASVSVSTSSFLLLEAAVSKSDVYRWNAQSQLLWVICVPQFLIFLISCCRTLFGDYEWPSLKVFLVQAGLEVLHAIGVATLVFRVLPHFGSFNALGLIHATSFIPAFLKIFFGKPSSSINFCNKEKLLKIADVIAFFIQMAALGIPLLIFETNAIIQQDSSSVHWQLPVSLILVSLKWWENFVGTNRFLFKLNDLKTTFHNTRITSNTILSTINIAVTILAMYAFEGIYGQPSSFDNYFHPPNVQSNSSAETAEVEKCNGDHCATRAVEAQAIGVVCTCSALLAYFLASMACKLMMQKVSFALPLVACAPTVMGLMYLQCIDEIPKINAGGFEFEFSCNKLDLELLCCALWWLSMVWISRHMWNPEIDRLAFNDRIFVTKLYSGPLVTQALMMNRRNDRQDKNFKWMDTEINAESDKSSYDEGLTWEARRKRRIVPQIYACGTMWHETRNEMIQLLKSIMRMDIDQRSRRLAEEFFEIIDPDYYEFETHIFFDDCMDIDDNDEWIPNQFVVQFISCVDEAASSVHNESRELDPPVKTITPYGGSLTWELPCGNKMIVHLKDKNKIRHRKRWSQVMYMYHLLGYRLFDEPDDEIEQILTSKESSHESEQTTTTTQQTAKDGTQTIDKPKVGFGQSETFQMMSERKMLEAENTFLLALDGDVDFKPDAVRLLVDRMKVNPRTGAVCGRIHPIGQGPMVWYQKFEYAVGHWFQKATEHILGCVLCSPGCFSLFRGSALLDDNVMKRYTAEPTEAAHYVQYDQGEDRWLCTLLLQQGYFVDYCAASDALTFAPENFDEFFNQRRRWTPSTIANVIDLLSDTKNTVNINANISYLYVMYQFLLMISMVLGPSTIILAIATAFQSVFAMSLWQSYLLSILPVIFYLVICFKCKTKTQLLVAQLLSTIYACIMTVVLVGVIQTIVTSEYLNPTLLFLAFITASFIFAGIIHPYEFFCLLYGVLYYLCIPAGYLILMIYSMSNLHVVSWGTREVKKRKSKAQMEREKALEEQKQAQKLKKKGGIFSYLRLDVFFKELKDTLTEALGKKKDISAEKKQEKYMRRMLREMRKLRLGDNYLTDSDSESEDGSQAKSDKSSSVASSIAPVPIPVMPEEEEEIEIAPDDVENPAFINHPSLGNGEIKRLPEKEKLFFHRLIVKYLKPIKKNKKKEEALKDDLIELRNHSSFGFWFMNLLWVLFNYMINRDNNLNLIYVFGYETQPLGFIFIIFFVLVLTLQIIGMIMHRWATFLQLISITELTSPLKKVKPDSDKISPTDAIKIAHDVLQPHPFFDDKYLTTTSNSTIGDPQQRARNVIRNAHKLASRENERGNRRYKQRHPRKGDHAISIDDNQENDQPRERLDKRLDRHHHDRRRASRDAITYRDTMQRHFREHYGHLSGDTRGGGARHRFGGGNDRNARRNPSPPTSGYRRHQGRGYEDPNERAMRRLRRLAAY